MRYMAGNGVTSVHNMGSWRDLAVFERGIANRLDFSFAGPQSRKLAELVASGSLKIGAIHTYLELYGRMLVDLTPRVALVVADKADRYGNLSFRYAQMNFGPVMATAATLAIAEVRTITDEPLPHDRIGLPGVYVDRVVAVPA